MVEPPAGTVQIMPIAGLPEFRPGDDLAGLICGAAPWLRDGDILVVTSKAVSKVEGRLRPVPTDRDGADQARQAAIEAETARVVAERGAIRVAVTHHGWVMAAAGVDASNVQSGEIALLPLDSDASARQLRETIRDTAGVCVAIVISDTNGRTWRHGLTDIAIGVAGMASLSDLRGQLDSSGVPLEITEIAVADELAAAADLVKGKLSGVPAAVIRGLPTPVDDGKGAAALRRSLAEDMFAWGTRDVVRSRRAPTGFAAGKVSRPVLRAAITVAEQAAGTSDSFELASDNPWHGESGDPSSPTARLVGDATALIVPMLPARPDSDAYTGLGMSIAALLIQLHAEGLAASWVTPREADLAGLQVADLEAAILGGAGRAMHGFVVVGLAQAEAQASAPAQIER